MVVVVLVVLVRVALGALLLSVLVRLVAATSVRLVAASVRFVAASVSVVVVLVRVAMGVRVAVTVCRACGELGRFVISQGKPSAQPV